MLSFRQSLLQIRWIPERTDLAVKGGSGLHSTFLGLEVELKVCSFFLCSILFCLVNDSFQISILCFEVPSVR